uniref:Uncharacterized protein n=1 Tax=viral metagenome TaxID=1070528 RepID=A0A6C0CUA0_9ZZZZ
MPTPSASQFTQLQKFNAIAARQPDGKSQQKTFTAMYQPVPSVPNPTNFLASPGTKFTSTRSFIPINRVTGFQYKPKVPAGFGNPGAGLRLPIIDSTPVPISRFLLSNLVLPPYTFGGYTPGGSGATLVGFLYSYNLLAPINYFPDTTPTTGGNSIGTITTPITTTNVNPLSYLLLRFSASNFPNQLFRLYPTAAGGMVMYIGRKNTALTLDDVVNVMNNSIGQPNTYPPNVISQEIIGTGGSAGNSSYLITDFTSASDFVDVVLINFLSVLSFSFQLDVLRNPRADRTFTWPITQFGVSPIILPITPPAGPFNIMVIRFINPLAGMNYLINATVDSFSGGFQSITFDGDMIENITGFTTRSITFRTKFTPQPSSNVQTITLVFADADSFADTADITSIVSFS